MVTTSSGNSITKEKSEKIAQKLIPIREAMRDMIEDDINLMIDRGTCRKYM